MVSTSLANLTCLCGAISVPATILAQPNLPISTGICHCNVCRQTTGSLGAAFPPLDSPPTREIISKLTAYHSSEDVIRYFCSRCGCHCFCVVLSDKQWFCLGGIIETGSPENLNDEDWPKDTIKVSSHRHVLDTIDGGITPILLNLDGRSIPTWSGESQEGQQVESFDLSHASILDLPSKSTSNIPKLKDDSYLEAKCHCGGVSLLIKRANYTLSATSQDSARYVPSNNKKYLTYFCTCRSCRLSTGVSMLAWSLVPPENIFNANAPTIAGDYQPIVFGYPVSDPANPGLSLEHYWSSPDVCRSFCGKCGATVSYWCGQRPTELDLTVGILRSEDGSMARQWLEWIWGRCSFTEESIDKEISEAWVGCTELMGKLSGEGDGKGSGSELSVVEDV
jgi:hypothetical protein